MLAGVVRRLSPKAAVPHGPPQYRGSGWSGAWSGQDPSEVLGGPAAASAENPPGSAEVRPVLALGQIRRGQPQKPSA